MLPTCNSACVDTFTLTTTDQCDIYQRSEIPVRLIVATCNTTFPTGAYDDIALATAFESLVGIGSISATFELADFSWSDPTTTTKQYRSRRSPAKTITTGRTLTARDYTATDVNAAGSATPYQDRLFFVNTLQNAAVKYRGWITADGRIYLFLNSNGEFMSYDVNHWYGQDVEVEGQVVEFKNMNINFTGDPTATMTTPYLDLLEADPTDTLGLAWMYRAN